MSLTGAIEVSGGCQDGSTSSRMITQVKHLELNQFSVGRYLPGSMVAQGNGKFGPCRN